MAYKRDGEAVNWTNVVPDVPEQVVVGRYLQLSAPPQYGDYSFDHWEYDGNSISTADLTLRPSKAGVTITVTACYVSSSGSTSGRCWGVTETYAETVNGVNKVAITMAWSMPEGCEAETVGFYASRDFDQISGDNPTCTKTAKTPTDKVNGSYTLHISSKSGTNADGTSPVFYARPYIIYKDAEGNLHTELGIDPVDIYALNWDELAEKGVR